MSHTQEATDDPFLDEEWLATKGPRSRWRLALWAALAVSVVFLAGAQVQKHFGTSSSTASAGAPPIPRGQGKPPRVPPPRGARRPELPRRSRNPRRIPHTRWRRVHPTFIRSIGRRAEHLPDRNRHPSQRQHPPGQGLRRQHPHHHDRGPHHHHSIRNPPHRHQARFDRRHQARDRRLEARLCHQHHRPLTPHRRTQPS